MVRWGLPQRSEAEKQLACFGDNASGAVALQGAPQGWVPCQGTVKQRYRRLSGGAAQSKPLITVAERILATGQNKVTVMAAYRHLLAFIARY